MKKRIGVIGKTALDILVHGVDLKSIKSGATNTVDGLILELGGAALNVATAAAHKIFKREHEIEVYLYTQVCDDGLLNSKLEEHCRINEISLVNLGGVAATPRICVLVHNDNSRSRTFLCGKSDGKMSKVTLPENFANELSECDVLVLAGITPDHPVLEDDWCRVLADAKILREQKKPESPLIIAIDILLVDDLQKKNISRVYSVLSLADYFFPNSEELWQVWDYLPNSSNSRRGRGTRSSERSKNAPEDSREISDLKEISRDFFSVFTNLRLIGIKRGRHGVLLLEHYISPDDEQGRFKVNSVPSTNVSTKDIIDSTGAGDTWVGGFLSGALVSSSNSPDHLPAIAQGARYGNAVAGCSIKHIGAVEWSRSCSETEVLSQVSAIPTGVIRIEEEFC